MSKTIEQLDTEIAAATDAATAASMDWALCDPWDHERIAHASKQWTERMDWLKTVMAARNALKQAQQNG